MKKIREPKERMSGEERRLMIIDVALKLFAEKGFNGTKTKEIARLAGISETLIFQHFSSKEDLYQNALNELFKHHPVVLEVEQYMKEKNDAAVLRTLALHIINHCRKDPRIAKITILNALEGPILDGHFHKGGNIAAPITDRLASYIKKRSLDGAFKNVNADIVARLFIETIDMYIVDQDSAITGPRLHYTDEEVVDTLVHVFLDGIRQ